jgi:hypothetical protein
VVADAEANASLQDRNEGEQPTLARRTGDALTEWYMRRAARSAMQLPDQVGPTALVLALGIALDDSEVLRLHPRTRDFVAAAESMEERATRLRVLGTPTLRGRRDLAKHFVVSAYLAAVGGRSEARGLGLAKEIVDAQGKSGFSAADLAANEAGILFSTGLTGGSIRLPDVADRFTVLDYLPDVSSLPEGIRWEQLPATLSATSPSQRPLLEEVRRLVRTLPAYQAIEGP